MKTHIVQAGEDIATIAYSYGVAPEKILELEENKELFDERVVADVLKEGDELTIPDPKFREEKIASGQRHHFCIGKPMPRLRIALDDNDEPLANVPYLLKLKDQQGNALPEIASRTNDKGILDQAIPVDAKEGELILNFERDNEMVIPIRLGEIDPVNVGFRGVQAMLNNLGYECGNEDDSLGEKTKAAVKAFQEDNYLEPIADDAEEIDEFTLAALEEAYMISRAEKIDGEHELYEDDEIAEQLDKEEEEDMEEVDEE